MKLSPIKAIAILMIAKSFDRMAYDSIYVILLIKRWSIYYASC